MAIVYDNDVEYAVECNGIWGVKMAIFAAKKRTAKEEAHFAIYLYDIPEEQVVPSAQISFSELSAAPLLSLISKRRNIDTVADDGKRLVFLASNSMIALYNHAQDKKPSAALYLPQQMIQTLAKHSIQSRIFRALGIGALKLA